MEHKSEHFAWPRLLIGATIVLLLALTWFNFSAPPAALGQVPDSGAQRLDMIRELRTANTRLAEIVTLLQEVRDGLKGRTTEPAGPSGGVIRRDP